MSPEKSPAAEFNAALGQVRSLRNGELAPEADFIQIFFLGFKVLREIRDKHTYREGGFVTFRHWAVSLGGEGVANWLEQIL